VYGFPTKYILKGIPPKHIGFDECPDFCYDLNAMHEAEKMLTRKSLTQDYFNVGYGRYQTILCEMSLTPLCATAKQRAEAFVKTICKWEN